MKKILAIGLASAMMTTTAFATTLTRKNIEPGAQIKFSYTDFISTDKIYVSDTAMSVGGADINANAVEANTYKVSDKAGAGLKELTGGYGHADNIAVRKLGSDWSTVSTDEEATKKYFGLKYTGGSAEANYMAHMKTIAQLARHDIQPYDFTAQNFRITLNAPTGRNLIKSTTFDGAGNLIVTLRDNFKLPSTAGPDLVISDLYVTSLRDIKTPNTADIALKARRTFTVDRTSEGGKMLFPQDNNTIITVGVEPREEVLSSGVENILTGDGEWLKFTNGDSYRGTVKFDDVATGLMVMGTVYSGDVVNFKYDAAPTDAAIKVLQNNPNAIVEVHNIMAKGFKTGFTVSIPANSVAGAEADENGNVEVLSVVAANKKKLYMLSSTGVLTAAPFTYNASTGMWQGKLPATGGTLLISDIALNGVTAGGNMGGNTNNPNTGFGVDFASAIVK